MKVCNTETKLASQGTVRIFQDPENIKNLELPNKKTTNVAKHQSSTRCQKKWAAKSAMVKSAVKR